MAMPSSGAGGGTGRDQANLGSSANRVGNFRDSEAIPVFDGNAIADW